MRRKLLAAVAVVGFAVPVSVGVIAMAPAAQASSNASCAKVKGAGAGEIEFLKCSPVPKADKKEFKTLSNPSAVALATGGTLTWNGGATVTFGPPTPITPPSNPCKSSSKGQDAVEDDSGTITAGDGVVALTGDTFHIELCVSAKNGKFYLAPGTSVSL